MKHLKKFENVAALAMPPESKVHKTLRKAKDKFTNFFDSDMDRENDRLHHSEMQLNVAKDLLHKVKTKYLHSDNIDNAIIIAEDALDTINNMGNFSRKDKYVNELKDIIQQLKDENNVRKYASPSKEEAEDVLQEVFVKIWKKYDQFADKSNLKTWIYRISVNTALDYNRLYRSETQKYAEDQVPIIQKYQNTHL